MLLLAPIAPAGEGVTGSLITLLLYVTVSLSISFLCSVLEAVLLSVSVSHVQGLAQQGKRAGVLMQRHRKNVERPISAILTLNTVAHTVGATLAGAEAAALFGSELVGVISAVLTLLILVLSEIIPKTLGAVYAKQLIPFAAYTTQVLLVVLFPAVWVFEQMGRAMRPSHAAPTVTRSDLEVMAMISQQEGALLERENRTLRNLLHLGSVRVDDIMTPRTVVLAFDQALTVGEVIRDHGVLPYSRLPIYDETIDRVIGYVLRHDIMSHAAADRDDVRLSAIKREIIAIPDTTTVAQALDRFIAQREHIMLVVDEYGGTAGVLSLEDVFESILGIEITDESDLVADLRKLAQERSRRKFDQVLAPDPPAVPTYDSQSDTPLLQKESAA